ncbi:MAG TPA: M23 family metallopeptidase [Firmicutes bacterium]|nr:M23 family metallopeptidase [Bacillota bacterium]
MAPPEKQSDRSTGQVKLPNQVLETCKQAWLSLSRWIFNAANKFKHLPRPLKVGTVYLAIVIVTASIFLWQMWSLRAAYPYISERNPDLRTGSQENDMLLSTEDLDRPAEGGALLPGAEQETEHMLPPPVNEPQVNSSSVQVTSSPNPGAWPVSGELWYSYHDPVTQKLNDPYVKYSFSKGLAIAADPGAEVRAVWEGVVIRVSKHGYPYGQAVIMQHDNGLITYYGALQELTVEEGSKVLQGEQIGYLAAGSGSDPSYLYLEVRENQKAVDPLLYLP